MPSNSGRIDLYFYASVAIVIASAVYFAFMCNSIWDYTMDDSYISFRYARNLVDGYGLRFNPTDVEPVEGFTSLLWLAAVVPSFLLRFPVEFFSKLISLFFVVGTAGLIGLCIYTVGGEEEGTRKRVLYPALGASAYFCFFPVFILSVSGMETALSSFLVALCAYQVLRFSHHSVKFNLAVVFALTLLALGLARPDLNIFSISMLFVAIMGCDRPEDRRWLTLSGAFYVLAGATYFLWRWWYFSNLLPLPFYIKSTAPGFYGVPDVLKFLGEPLVVLAFIFGIAAGGRLRGLWFAAIAYILFFTKPQHLMGEGYRFLMPSLPILIVVGMLGARSLFQRWSFKITTPLMFVATLAASVASIDFNQISFLGLYAKALKSTYGAIGEDLKNEGKKGVVAVSSVGVISYVSDWSVVDMFGLCNAEIARHPEKRLDVIFDAIPKYIVLVSADREKYTPRISQHRSDFNQDIYNLAVFKNYQTIKVYEFFSGFYLFLLKRPN